MILSYHSLRLSSNLTFSPSLPDISEQDLSTTLPKICHVLVGRQLESLHPWLPRPVNAELHLSPDQTAPCQDSHNARDKHYLWPRLHLDLVSGKDSPDNIFKPSSYLYIFKSCMFIFLGGLSSIVAIYLEVRLNIFKFGMTS